MSNAFEVSLQFKSEVAQATSGIQAVAQGVQGLQAQMASINKEMVAQSKAVQDTLVTMANDLKAAGDNGKNTLTELATGAVLGEVAMKALSMATNLVAGALRTAVGEGLRYNSVLEGAELGIASLISAQARLTDSQGRTLSGQEALTAAQHLAEGQMMALKIAGLETTATTEQLVLAFQQALAPGLAVGLTLDQIRKFSVGMSQAAGALQLPMNQLGEEVRSLLNGNIEPRNTRIATALGITNEKIKELKAEGPGALYEYLSQKLEAFATAGEKAAQTMSGVTSNVIEAGQTLAGEATRPLFDSLKQGLLTALKDVFDLKDARISDDFQGLIDLGQGVSATLGDLAGQALAAVVDGLKDLSAWAKEDRDDLARFLAVASDLAVTVGKPLAGALGLVVDIANGLMHLFGSMPQLALALTGATIGLAVAHMGLAAAATAAATAIKGYFLSMGPLGWAVVAIGALAGAFVGMSAAREADAKAAEKHADAQRKSVDQTGGLVRRHQELKDAIDSGKLSVAERARAEEEMGALRARLAKLDEGYAAIIRGETQDRDALCKKLWEEARAREASIEQQRRQVALWKAASEADLQNAQKRLRLMEDGRLPDTGAEASAAQKALMAQGWYEREKEAADRIQRQVDSLGAQLRALGGDALNLTLDQAKARISALREAITDADKEIKRLGASGGGAAETKTYVDKIAAKAALKAELDQLQAQFPDTVTPKANRVEPEKKTTTDAFAGLRNQLERDHLKTLQQQTLEQERQVALAEAQNHLREQMDALDAAEAKARKDGTYKGQDVALRLQATQNFQAARERIEEDFAQKRMALEEKVQGALTASEEGGLAKRLETIRKTFEKVREENNRLRLNGKVFLTSDQILEAEEAAKARARIEQIRADLHELNRQLTELATQKGRGLTDGEIRGVYKAFTAKDPSGTRSAAVGQDLDARGMDKGATAGLQAGVDSYLATSRNAFETWKTFATSVLGGTEGAFANFFTSLTQKGMDMGQKLKALWVGVSQSAVQALSKIAAQELVTWGVQKSKWAWDQIKAAWNKSNTAAEVAQSGVKTAANTAETTSSIGAAIAGFFKAHSWIPWVGFGIAAAFVANMMGLLKPFTGRKVGGLVGLNGPEATVLGEEGLEVVAPEHDFKDWARSLVLSGANLQANLEGSQERVRDYQRSADDYAQDAQEQGRRNLDAGRPWGGSASVVDNRGATFIGVDDMQWADMVMRGVRRHEGAFA